MKAYWSPLSIALPIVAPFIHLFYWPINQCRNELSVVRKQFVVQNIAVESTYFHSS